MLFPDLLRWFRPSSGPTNTVNLDLLDRRAVHSPLVRRNGKLERYTPAKRPWSKVTGICLHQTACNMGERIARYDSIGAHFAVLRSGRVLRMADCDRIVYHGNGWNNQTVGIEIDGLYAGIEGDIRTVWDDPSTPVREQPQAVTPEAMASARQLIRWICADVAEHGGRVTKLVAHRQSSMDRKSDPGQAIWQAVAVPMHVELGLDDGGVGFTIGGRAIPEEWDSRCAGYHY